MITLKFTLNLIKGNIGKVIMLIITLTSFFFAGRISDAVHTHKISQSFIEDLYDGKHYIYLYYDGNTNKYEVVDFDKPKKLTSYNVLTYTTYSGVNILLWAVFIILGIIFIVMSFTEDDGIGWEFNDIHHDTLYKFVVCMNEDNLYKYVLNNRILCSNATQIDSYYLRDLVKEYIKNRKIFPIFATIEDKRNNKLDKIGV